MRLGNIPNSRGVSRRNVVKSVGAIGLAGGLAGCTSGDQREDSGQQDEYTGEWVTSDRVGRSDAPNEFTYWTTKNSSHLAESATGDLLREDFFVPWAKNHHEFKINYQIQTSLGQLNTKLFQAIANGSPPDVSDTDAFWVPQIMSENPDALVSISNKIPDKDDWFPFVKDTMVQNGEFRTVWRNTDCRVLYYREDLIDKYADGEPPKTWNSLIKVGQEINANEDMFGYMYNGGRWEGTSIDNLAYFWAQGGTILDLETGEPRFGKGDNYDYMLNVLKFMRRTIDSGITPNRVVNIDDYALLREAALNGETAMFMGGNWQISRIKEVSDDWERWKVAEIPQPEASMNSTGAGGWSCSVFNDDETIKPAAADFATLWADQDLMGKWCEIGGFLPTRPSVYDEVDFFNEDPYLKFYGNYLDDASARPGHPLYNVFTTEFQIAVGKVITEQAAPKEALNTLVKNVDEEYEG